MDKEGSGRRGAIVVRRVVDGCLVLCGPLLGYVDGTLRGLQSTSLCNEEKSYLWLLGSGKHRYRTSYLRTSRRDRVTRDFKEVLGRRNSSLVGW